MSQIFCPADILLPDEGIDMSRWSVIACDQFTSQPEYWRELEKQVGDQPSTLRLTLPEVFLDTDEEEKRLEGIRDAMETYLGEGFLVSYPDSLIYIERTDSTGKVRAGIIGALDLEQYDYHKGSSSPIRATEGTIEERIPPRLRVRRNAPLELPHIMILIDDPAGHVIEPLADRTSLMKQVYDFDLMEGGGHLRGWLLDPQSQKDLLAATADLEKEADQQESAGHICPLVYAVGDGNHSLATAKACYEELKREHPGEDLSEHPARYALAEIVNLHSPALEFEAIHRIVTDVNTDELFAHMTKDLGLVKIRGTETAGNADPAAQCMTIVLKGQEERVLITRPSSGLTVGSLQNFLDAYISSRAGIEDIKVDYIHGRENLKALTWQNGSIGFLLPQMDKKDLFPTVIADGALPRKTFSMGHAEDKRYYTECRKIR